MKRTMCFVLLAALQVTSWSMYCGHGHGKEIELATDVPGPLSLEESQELFCRARGFSRGTGRRRAASGRSNSHRLRAAGKTLCLFVNCMDTTSKGISTSSS